MNNMLNILKWNIFLSITALTISEEVYDVSITYYNAQTKELNSIAFAEDRYYKVIFHGYNTNSSRSAYYIPMIEAYQQVRANILALDYGLTVKDVLYFPVLPRVPGLARQIGDTIAKIATENSIPLENFHFIGHSLGAQIAAFTAQHIKKRYNTTISRITGLDPAGVGFESKPPDQRLSIDDALFVDIIHTNAGEAGYWAAYGHIDFYPNGGTFQYGCSLDPFDACSHGRSGLYFAESILNNNFLARKCNSFLEYKNGDCSKSNLCYMGEYTNLNPLICNGIFYLETSDKAPFALG